MMNGMRLTPVKIGREGKQTADPSCYGAGFPAPEIRVMTAVMHNYKCFDMKTGCRQGDKQSYPVGKLFIDKYKQ